MRLAFFAVHFGLDYLEWGVRSVKDGVDQIHILYAPKPSYGFAVEGAICPHTEEQLHAAAKRGAGSTPLVWHRITASNEGQHKSNAMDIAHTLGAEAYVLMDADEVWDPKSLVQAMDYVCEQRSAMRWSVNFHHFWRSWKYTVTEHFRPIRIIDPKSLGKPDKHIEEHQAWPIFHFGYAQEEATMRYKFTCHSHRAELVEHNIDEWLEKKFYGWKPGDEGFFHPSLSLWTPALTDEATLVKLAEIMPDHPHRGKDFV